MSNANNNERFRRSLHDQCLIEAPVASATIIAKGDLVLLWAGKVIQPDDLGSIFNSEAAAIQEGARLFFGVAEDESEAGETLDVRVDVSTDSIWEYTQCTAAVASIGDLFGFCAVSTAANAWRLYNQRITPDCSYPIMQCVREKTVTSDGEMLCKMVQNRFNNRGPSWAADTCRIEGDASYAG
jgi:hypothetical protein